MAIGAALLFNIRLPINFNSPYKATSIQDFWRRWHVTLSRWLRDYVYIPLGGNRKGNVRIYANLITTFLLGGLWHGAGWTFVAWGAMHGLALAMQRLWKRLGIRLPTILPWFITFLFVNWTWVVFRAENFDSAAKVYRGMLGLNGMSLPPPVHEWAKLSTEWPYVLEEQTLNAGPVPLSAAVHMIIFGFVAFFSPNTVQLIALVPSQGRLLFKPTCTWGTFTAFVFFVATLQFLGNVAPSEFLYFNF